MSKNLVVDTEFTDIDLIREALVQQGFSPVFTEDYGARTMQGYAGTTFQANLGITKTNFTAVTGLSTFGDLGFATKADGSIEFMADDMLIETRAFERVYDGIKLSYSEQKYSRQLFQSGFAPLPRHVTNTGEVELTFVRMGGL